MARICALEAAGATHVGEHGIRHRSAVDILPTLAVRLAKESGGSFVGQNLLRIVQFAATFPDEQIVVSLIRELSWTPPLRKGRWHSALRSESASQANVSSINQVSKSASQCQVCQLDSKTTPLRKINRFVSAYDE